MATNQNLPATDSAAVLHELVGNDATAGFENDPTFVDSNPAADASSENLQTRSDRQDIRSQADIPALAAADEEDDDEDEDDDDDDEDLDEDDEDDELEDEDDEDDDEFEDDEDDDEEDDDVEDEDEE